MHGFVVYEYIVCLILLQILDFNYTRRTFSFYSEYASKPNIHIVGFSGSSYTFLCS